MPPRVNCWILAVGLSLAVILPGAGAQGTLSHSASFTITPGNSVACGGGAVANGYWRVYDLSFFGVAAPIQVDSVSFGVELAAASMGVMQTVTVRLYLDSDLDPTAGLTLVATDTGTVRNMDSGTVVTIPMTTPPVFVPGDIVVVELEAGAAGDTFFIGSNALGQSSPSYLSAAGCGILAPTDLALIGFPGMMQILDLNTSLFGGPPPCSVAGAISPFIPATVAGDTSMTGTNQITPSCGGDADDEIWTFTPLCNGTFTFSLCSGVTLFDSTLEIFDGDPCLTGASIACNDDFCGAQSEITTALLAGTTYYVLVDGSLGATGAYELTVTGGCPPCPAVVVLPPVVPLTALGDTSVGGFDRLDLSIYGVCGGNALDDLYEFTAPCDSTYRISLCAAAAYDTSLAIYDTEPCVTPTPPIACNDDFCGTASLLQVDLTGGTTYYILVDGFAGAAGAYQLDISDVGCGTTCPLPAPNCLACAAAYGFVAVEPDLGPVTANILTGNLNSFASTIGVAPDRDSITITATPVDPSAQLRIRVGLGGYDTGFDPFACNSINVDAPGVGQPVSLTLDCASFPSVHDIIWCTGNYAFWVENLGVTSDVDIEVTTSSSDPCGCPPPPPCAAEDTTENVAVSINSNGSVLPPQTFPYENAMETPAGFGVTGGPQDHRWELGAPSYVITEDHTRGSDTNCLATDLDGGVYEYLGEMVTTSPFVTLPAGVPNPSVSFWVYNNSSPTGAGQLVLGTVGIETSAAPGVVLSIHPNRFVFGQFPIQPGVATLCTGSDVGGPAGWWFNESALDPDSENGWAMVTIDLSSFAGRDVRLHWNYRNLEDPAPGCFPLQCAAPGLMVDDLKFGYQVVINEVRPGGAGPDETWIELFSLHPTPINLDGWTLEVNDGMTTDVATLGQFELRTNHGVVVHEGASPFGVDQTWAYLWNCLTTGMDFTTGGAVTLRDPAGRAVDFVRWGGNATAVPAGLRWEETVPVGNPAAATDTIARTRTAVDTGSSADWDVMNGRDSAIPTPAFDNDDTTPLEIVSVSMKSGSVGAAYLDKLEAIGGVPPYTWSLNAGTLPVLSMGPWAAMAPEPVTGVFSTGVDTIALGQEGTFNLTVRVTDSMGNADLQDLVLSIGPLTPDMVTHAANGPDTGMGFTIDWQFRDTSSTETGFLIRDPMGVVVAGIGPTCPPLASGVTVPVGGCHAPGETQEVGLAENTQITRTAHSVQVQPSLIQGVVINEIDIGQNDMIELYNYDQSDVDLSGWTINLNQDVPTGIGAPCSCGGVMPTMTCNSYTFPPGTILQSRRTIRVYDNGNPLEDTAEIKNVGFNWQPDANSLFNVELIDNLANLVDYVEINGDYTCGVGTGVFAGFITTGGSNKIQRVFDLDRDTAADWVVTAGAGTPGSLNPGQAGLIIFNAESTIFDPMINTAMAYTSVHDPLPGDLSFVTTGDFNIELSINPPQNSTADNTGVQVEWFEDGNLSGLPDGIEVVNPVSSWMAVVEPAPFLDPADWSNVYSHDHTSLSPATQYCYRFRYRNGDGDPLGPGDITPWSSWSCAVTTSSCNLALYPCGDCNGNQQREITDSLRMAQIASGLAPAPAWASDEFNACNVKGAAVPDGSASITILDALWNANYIIGRVTLECCVP